MALTNLAAWNKKATGMVENSACGSACGSRDKLSAACGSACGSGDKVLPAACGSACGSGDK